MCGWGDRRFLWNSVLPFFLILSSMESRPEDLRIVSLLTNQGEAVFVCKPTFWTDSIFLKFERASNGAQAGPAYDRTEPMYNWRHVILALIGIVLR
ncbi:unnamed protein product [Macrosiphum euphorbiae]|uniref:Uncharacterized protein n=1 Tax=Macrosiphum euphorbiae TaxID=13131 RepID=A0AAV0VRD4_9HEMI|nr:unnamed protein product [Macrosiphum euphorbiae]